MKKPPVYGAVMLVLLTLAFSPTSAESISAPTLLPGERTVITADNLNAVKRLATWGSGHLYDAAWMDAQHIAFTSDAGTWVYELYPTPVPVRLFTPPAKTVFAAPDSDWVITYTDGERFDIFSDNVLTAWNLSGESQPLLAVSSVLGTPESLKSPVMHNYGTAGAYVVASQGADVYLWPGDFSSDPLHFAQPASNRTDYFIEMAALSSDGKRLATAARALLSDQLIISVWDTDSGKQHIIYQDDYLPLARLILWHMQFNANGHELAAYMGSLDDQHRLEMGLRRWDATTGKALNSVELSCPSNDKRITGSVLAIKYAANFYLCRFFAPDGSSRLETRSISTGEIQASVDTISFEPTYAFSPDNRYMAVVDGPLVYEDDPHYLITVWDMEHNQRVTAFRASSDQIVSLAFSPDGQQLLSASAEGSVRIWNMDNEKPVYLIEPGHSLPVSSLAFSPDGRWLVSAATNPYDNNYLGMQRGFVARWNLQTGQYEKLLDGADSSTTSIIFSPDGKRLYLGDLEGNLRIWDGETFTPQDGLSNPGRIQTMALNLDGSLLAAAGDQQVWIWDTRTKTIINQLQTSMPANFCPIQFSPYDAWLRLCTALWKVENHGKLIANWQAADLPEALTGWYQAQERQIRFDPTQADGKGIYWVSPGYSAPYSPASIAFSPSHDLIAVGQGSGLIELYGIEKAG